MKNSDWNKRMMKDFNARSLLHAVVVTMNRYDEEKLKPGSDHWISNTVGRTKLLDEVSGEWAKIQGCEQCDFPYNVDGVARMWIAYRKSTEHVKATICRELFGEESEQRQLEGVGGK